MTPPSPLRVVVADDERLFRECLVEMLAGAGVDVTGESEDGEAAWDAIRSASPDVALVDLYMPVLDGIGVAGRVARSAVPTRVLLLTGFGAGADVRAALRAGAAGFLRKSTGAASLVHAVRHVAAGGVFLGEDLREEVLGDLGGHRDGRAAAPYRQASPSAHRWGALSERERQVVRFVAAGHDNPEIARRIGTTSATVKRHLSNALAKLGLRNRAEAVVWAYRTGLVRGGPGAAHDAERPPSGRS